MRALSCVTLQVAKKPTNHAKEGDEAVHFKLSNRNERTKSDERESDESDWHSSSLRLRSRNNQ